MKIYQENIKKCNSKILSLNKVLTRISLLRLLIFAISSAILIYLLSIKLFIPFLIVLPISVLFFALIITRHNKLTYLRKHTSFLKRINEDEILRGKCNLEEFDTGKKFIDPSHRYTSDLDIFGQHSVFQLANRTTTESGMILLSEWLSEPAANDEIQDRQKAIKELAQKLDWRQDFQASGMHFQNKKSDYYKLLDWVEAPIVLLKHRRIFKAIAIILPLLFLLSFYFFYVNLDSLKAIIFLSVMIIVLFINYMILRKVNPLAEHIVETSTANLKTLRGYRTLINKIESEHFKSEKLYDLQSVMSE